MASVARCGPCPCGRAWLLLLSLSLLQCGSVSFWSLLVFRLPVPPPSSLPFQSCLPGWRLAPQQPGRSLLSVHLSLDLSFPLEFSDSGVKKALSA